MNLKNNLLLYGITDRSWINDQTLYEQVKEALEGGVTIIQLREKDLDQKAFVKEAKEIKPLCLEYNVPFIINDNIEVAIQSEADGIHIGQKDISVKKARSLIGKNKILGVSANNLEQALKAQEDGADYLGVGAIFPTNSKKDAKNTSLSELAQICHTVKVPVVAIGGINQENISILSDTGISGVAVISALFGASNIEKEAKLLRKKLKKII